MYLRFYERSKKQAENEKNEDYIQAAVQDIRRCE